jgi:hypothetical protein
MQGLAQQMRVVQAVAMGSRTQARGEAPGIQPIHWQLHDLQAEHTSSLPVQLVLQRAVQQVILDRSLRAQQLLMHLLLGMTHDDRRCCCARVHVHRVCHGAVP